MTGHPGKVVVAGAAEPHRPRKCRSGRLGQVTGEVQARLFGGVLVVERLDRIAASVNLRTQPRGLLAQGIGAVATVYLDVQQGQILPAGRDANRRRIRAGRQVADHDSPQPRLYAHRAAALHAGAVPENGHGRDRRIKTSALRHPPLLFRRAFFHGAAPCPRQYPPIVSPSPMIRPDCAQPRQTLKLATSKARHRGARSSLPDRAAGPADPANAQKSPH